MQRAGFDVTGVDIAAQPNYVGERFIQGDAFELIGHDIDLDAFDFIWASPPCQGRTAYKRRPNHVRDVDTDGSIKRIRAALRESSAAYAIENVPGAPLIDPVVLCGSMFGLDVRRHRCFESSFPMLQPACRHDLQQGNFPQATNRKNRRRTAEIGVWRIPLNVQQHAMGGVGWMTLEELSESIPPAYARWIAEAWLASRRVRTSQA